ncbi:MAG TPA: PRC-barrel domain containing protein [Sphingomicrobium sp.]|nr:PRC-barrel domain containing protein [Sphingomicrobium sp.]
MTDILPWAATAATVTAALMTASNLGSRITGYGFAVFTIGSLCWLAIGLTTGQAALLWTNVVLTGLNLFGVWRWLGRQARVEEGTEAASKASEAGAGETLFPAALLTKAAVDGRDGPLGTCVDAMVGCDSGRIAYLGVAQGGLAGVGETIRRVAWRDVRVDGDTIRVAMVASDFQQAEEIEKDRWPAH